MANEVSVEITVEEKAALAALAKLTKGIDNLAGDAKKSVKKMDLAFASFAGNLAADFAGKAMGAAASALKNFVSGSISAGAQVEKLKTQFEILTGSTKKARDLFQELTDFSASTPFQLNDIAEAGAQLLSFGFEANTVATRMQKIGDVAAGSGAQLKDVSLIFGQVKAAAKLSGERLLQFQERAIPIGPAIAKTMGIAESEVKDFVSKGKVNFADFEKAFNSMSETGGLFEGAIAKQSKTVNGAVSTMSDNFDIMQAALGEAFAPAVVESAGELSKFMQSLTASFAQNGPAMTRALTTLAEILVIKPANFLAELVDDLSDKLPDVNKEIEYLSGQLKLVAADYAIQKDNSFSKFIGADKETLESMNNLNAKLEILKEKRTALITQDAALKSIASDEFRKFTPKKEPAEIAAVAASDPKEDARVLKEKAVIAELNTLRAEQQIFDDERVLLLKEAAGLATESDLEELRSLEAQKISVKAEGELAKIDLIKDSREKELALQKLAVKTSSDLDKLETKNSIDELKARKAASETASKERLSNLQSTLGSIATLQASGSKEGFVIGKAAAIADHGINASLAVSRALGSAPPPFNFILAGLVGAAMAVQGAKIASSRPPNFNTGGVIGGYQGVADGPDNININARRGEMVLNGSQQKTLFDNINSGGNNGGEMVEIKAAILELASQPIVLEINNKEIARATRDAQRDGFRITA